MCGGNARGNGSVFSQNLVWVYFQKCGAFDFFQGFMFMPTLYIGCFETPLTPIGKFKMNGALDMWVTSPKGVQHAHRPCGWRCTANRGSCC